jgi:hypothetical protein
MDFISKIKYQETFFPVLTIPVAIFLYLYLGGKGSHDYQGGYITIQVFAIVLLVVSFWEFSTLLFKKIIANKNQNTQKNLLTLDISIPGTKKKKDLTFDAKFILILGLLLILIGMLTFQKKFELTGALYNENQLFSVTLFITGWLLFISVLQDFRVIVASIFISFGLFFIHNAIAQKNIEFQVLSFFTVIVGFLLIQNYLLDIDGKHKRTLKDINKKAREKDLMI